MARDRQVTREGGGPSGARASAGVTGVVDRTEGGITYADVAYALANKLKFARVQNAAKKFTLPGLRSITAAAA